MPSTVSVNKTGAVKEDLHVVYKLRLTTFLYEAIDKLLTKNVKNLTGSHGAVGEVVAGEDLVLIHLSEHPGLPQIWNQGARPHPQGNPMAVVINQFPQFLLVHLLQVLTFRNTLPRHPECVVCVKNPATVAAVVAEMTGTAGVDGANTHP